MKLSKSDRAILTVMQADATLSLRDIAERVAMSQSTVWRRIQDLEARGVIARRVTLLDPAKAGMGVCVFVQVNLRAHDLETRTGFERMVAACPEILNCYAVTGGFDYTLIIRAESVEAFETLLMERILAHPGVANSASQLALREVKHETALPL
jgi:DNA-binding Lrp family transcriptional regulator